MPTSWLQAYWEPARTGYDVENLRNLKAQILLPEYPPPLQPVLTDLKKINDNLDQIRLNVVNIRNNSNPYGGPLVADDTTIPVVRFEVDSRSGTPTTARVNAYESQDDRSGYALSALGKSDPHTKLLKAAIAALAAAWPDTPDGAQIRVNKDREVVEFIFPQAAAAPEKPPKGGKKK
jgi:hypothetical protein